MSHLRLVYSNPSKLAARPMAARNVAPRGGSPERRLAFPDLAFPDDPFCVVPLLGAAFPTLAAHRPNLLKALAECINAGLSEVGEVGDAR